jgi:3-oxoacyl-[acyl-carrier-protein] synthase-1
MRRVVVTGIGIVSCIGNNKTEVLDSLLNTKSGIVFSEEHKKYNFRSQVVGAVKNLDIEKHIDRKIRRFMGDGSAYSYIALKEAIEESGLEEKEISNEQTGIIMGSGGPSIKNVYFAVDTIRKSAPKKMGPYIVPRTMASTCSATLAVPFKIKGVNYSISSACATSGHCIGNGMELIQYGKQDIVFVGGGEELDWALSGMFDAMPALSSKYNNTPEEASRPYDKDRDGFVIAGGAGAFVLEEYEHAKARGAKIYAELTGYGATSDGYDMVAPSGEGAVRCMKMALKTARNKIDYINAHGTSTPVGDITELNAIKETFQNGIPKISSTKSLTGHPLGAASAHEAIYSLIMMKNNFIAASANIKDMDNGAKPFPIVTKVEKNVSLNAIMSNSFGFGGTNSALVFEKLN